MEVTLIDSPFANLGSIRRSLEAAGAEVSLSSSPEEIAASRAVVLPGVGSFGPAARWIRESGIARGLTEARDRSASILGICLGHQLLFENSEEGGGESGLGFIRGTVRRFDRGLPVPQIGWNRVNLKPDWLFDGIEDQASFYFVHSYYATGLSPESEIATAYYAVDYPVAARNGKVTGVQFHPERSSAAGIRVLSNFVRLGANGGSQNE